MKNILFLLLLSSQLYSQESRFRITGVEKLNDSLIQKTGELMIFNNTGHQICLKVSTSFYSNILSSDTIELAAENIGNNCLGFNLGVTKADAKMGLYDIPQYPLVLNSRTCFFATISLLKNINCKNSWIEFSYLNDPSIEYDDLVKKFDNHQVWNIDPKIKYRSRKVYF